MIPKVSLIVGSTWITKVVIFDGRGVVLQISS